MRKVSVGEKGFDVGTNYPSAQAALEQGYTFMCGYDSTNPGKNLPRNKADEYLDAGLAVFIVFEINAGRTTLGGTVGTLDGLLHKSHMDKYGYPVDAPSIAANDTDTTNVNIIPQTAYHENFKIASQRVKGLYGDIDIGYATEWDLGWLPNAWSWDHPNPRLKSESIKAATALGYHMIQGRLTDNLAEPSYDVIDGINVDINWCIKDCYGWGNPKGELEMIDIVRDAETGNDKYMVTNDGTLRPLSAIELTARGITNSATLGNPVDKAGRDSMGYYKVAPVGSVPTKINLALDLHNETATGTLS